MSSKPVKVLTVGDVNGRFQELLKRVKTIIAKSGPFDILLCVGEFFGPDSELNNRVANGDIQFPIATYVLGPCCPSTSTFYPEENAEFSPNLTYLGRKGVLNTAQGLTIGYVSGIEAVGEGAPNVFEFDDKTVDDLLLPVRAQSGFLGVDILLSSVWPNEARDRSEAAVPLRRKRLPLRKDTLS
uniref:CN hydrolase domain-containing protein n=1 Tax=Panagrellus redivivus TaxID=6233 RepID=A0A7E4W9E9_PANRE